MSEKYNLLEKIIKKLKKTVSTEEQLFTDAEKVQVKSNLGIVEAQSDWGQNDPTQPDYVKNRTHYIEYIDEEIHNGSIDFEETSYDPFGDGSKVYINTTTINIKPYTYAGKLPDSILFQIDGQLYDCPLKGAYVNISVSGCLSEYKLQIGDDYLTVYATYTGYNSLKILCSAGLINSNFIVSVKGPEYHTLDSRFIPDNIARTSDIPTVTPQIQSDWDQYDSGATNYIQNRTHGIAWVLYDSYEGTDIELTEVSEYYQADISLIVPKISPIPTAGKLTFEGTSTDFTFGKSFYHNGVEFLISYNPTVQYNGSHYYLNGTIKIKQPTVSDTLKLCLYYLETKQLSEEYIPDTIPRVSNSIIRVSSSYTNASTWTGNSDYITDYYDGLTILYKVPTTGPGGGVVSLSINGMVGKSVYVNGSNLLNQYSKGSYLILVYDSGRWNVACDLDTKDTTGCQVSNGKLYLLGSLTSTQYASSSKSYTKSSCYLGTDNCLYINNSKVITEDDIDAQSYVITGNCTVVDSDIECSLNNTPDIEKIRDCISTGKPCYLYLEDSDDGQYRIFTPVMDYEADGRIRFQHPDGNTVYTLDLDADDPTNIPGYTSELITTNSVYTTQVDGNNYGIFDQDSDDYIPTNASVIDAMRNRWVNYTITNNADGTYTSPVTFSNLNNMINNGREVVFRFTDCTGRNVVVPQINRGISNLIDGKLYLYFSLVYPGLTEDTWNNTYRVFISINSSNELVVKHDVISNATVSAINTISEKLEA